MKFEQFAPTPDELYADDTVSPWLKRAVRDLCNIDPHDAAMEMAILANVMERYLEDKLKQRVAPTNGTVISMSQPKH